MMNWIDPAVELGKSIHQDAGKVFEVYAERAAAYPKIAAQIPELRGEMSRGGGYAYWATKNLADRVHAADASAAWAAKTNAIREAAIPYEDLIRSLSVYVDGDNRDTRWDPHGLNSCGWTEGAAPGPGDVVVWHRYNTNNDVTYYLTSSDRAKGLAAALAPFDSDDNRPLPVILGWNA